LQETVLYYYNVTVLPFDGAAAIKLAEFRKQKVRLSTQDLRIAAIVLSVEGILMICNTRDFRKVPGLSVEDWSRT
jgi:tRNA(fMet)-specific endonuclease VapC